MVGLLELWLAILLSAVIVFIASAIIHMVLPLHRGDYVKMPGEEEILAAMRARGVGPGDYMFPHAKLKDLDSPEVVAKFDKGPVGHVTILPSGLPAMGKNLVQWFLFSILISIFVAYLASLSAARGAPYMDVFRITSTTAILGYGIAHIPNSIWKGQRWGTTAKFLLDGVIYGLLTAGVFGWLWPAAT